MVVLSDCHSWVYVLSDQPLLLGIFYGLHFMRAIVFHAVNWIYKQTKNGHLLSVYAVKNAFSYNNVEMQDFILITSWGYKGL